MSLLTSSLQATIRSLAVNTRFKNLHAKPLGFYRRTRYDPLSAQVNSARGFKPRFREGEFHRRRYMCRGEG